MDGYLTKAAARSVLSSKVGAAARAYLGRPFSAKVDRRLLVYYHPNPISWAQIYPFAYYADRIRAKYGTDIRFRPVEDFLSGRHIATGQSDVVLVQPWFDVERRRLAHALETLVERHRPACVAFMDSFAHSDIRLMGTVDPYVDVYVKKSLFKDRSLYLRPFRGDTNLTEYYGDLYGIEADAVDWQVPSASLSKLRAGPNFHTAPIFLDHLSKSPALPDTERGIDIQTRLGTKGSEWYSAMRSHAMKAVHALEGTTQSPPGRLSRKAYMREMKNSKLCFSPFGYGELCWRDIEAFVTGAVLVKPSMEHLDTLPDLYSPGVTYLPIRWDFADLDETVHRALADPDLRSSLSRAGHDRLLHYVRTEQFVNDIAFLFEAP
ncbi:glycosyltransferase [Jannaschia sp. 2305UL9-9]|uniref:glycosyltransferase n=1 Tax=Jannaschia sp. 2305UL9-9 TaxID=3121638 RepID=UPI0035290787